jgi:ubiquinone biosynthesis protein UbiJ
MNVSSSHVRLPADIVREKLAQYLGPFTAKNAVQMMSKQAAGTDADRVTRTQIPAVLEALGPTLRTLLGKATAEKVADEIRKELAL